MIVGVVLALASCVLWVNDPYAGLHSSGRTAPGVLVSGDRFGKQRHFDEVRFASSSGSVTEQIHVAVDHVRGDAVMVLYDPDDPGSAVEIGNEPSHYKKLVAVIAGVAAIAAFLGALIFRTTRSAKEPAVLD